MASSIIAFLLPIATYIFQKYVEDKKTDAKTREAYLNFLETMQKSASTPAAQRSSYQDQIKRLKESQPVEQPGPKP